ncbi:hypothetical protein [Methylobacterium komagatae]
MENLRRLLVWCSALAAGLIFVGWIIFNRTFDILPFGVIALLYMNAFYIYFSTPKYQTSDILEQVSSKLTLVSLELKYMSQESKIKEAELEAIRQVRVDEEKFKLQVARDVLEHLQRKLPTRKAPLPNAQQIAHRPMIGNEVLARFAAKPRAKQIDGFEPVNPAIMKEAQSDLLNRLPPRAST